MFAQTIKLRRVLRVRWTRWLGLAVLLAALATLSAMDHRGWFLYDGGDWVRYHGRAFTVERVTDGDTLWLAAADGDEPVTKVRLWGIDTPEKAWVDGEVDEPFAQAASALTQELALGREVTLHLQRHRLRGSFGRLLVYAALPGGTVLNEALLARGLAVADDRWPHEHDERYALLQEQAQKEKLNLWREGE